MLTFLLRILFCSLLLLGGLWWITRGLRAQRRLRRQAKRALRSFEQDRDRLVALFFEAAREKEVPPKLRWERCELTAEKPFLSQDQATGELYALARIQVRFSKVKEPRSGTAIFVWRGHAWQTDGRVLLDLTPTEAFHQHRKTLVSLTSVEPKS